MHLRKIDYLILLFISIVVCGCSKNDYSQTPIKEEVWFPIYVDSSAVHQAVIMPPISKHLISKTIVNNSIVLEMELRNGIHVSLIEGGVVIPKSFIEMKGILEMYAVDDVLYISQYKDLVKFDIKEYDVMKEIFRVNNHYNIYPNEVSPPVYGGYYECIDHTKGLVIDWFPKANEAGTCFSKDSW